MQPAKFCHVKGLTLEGSAFLFSFKPLVSSFSGHQTGVASRISIQVPLVCPPADPRLHRHGHRLRNICDATFPALRMPPPAVELTAPRDIRCRQGPGFGNFHA